VAHSNHGRSAYEATTTGQRIAALRSDDPLHRTWAAEHLALSNEDEVTRALAQALDDLVWEDDWEFAVARSLIEALRQHKTDTGAEAILRALEASLGHDHVPDAACRALGELRYRPALPKRGNFRTRRTSSGEGSGDHRGDRRRRGSALLPGGARAWRALDRSCHRGPRRNRRLPSARLPRRAW
jgi:hypothetical protein